MVGEIDLTIGDWYARQPARQSFSVASEKLQAFSEGIIDDSVGCRPLFLRSLGLFT